MTFVQKADGHDADRLEDLGVDGVAAGGDRALKRLDRGQGARFRDAEDR